MTEPEEEQEKTQKTDAVLKPPTANPTRTRVRDADQKARNALQQSEQEKRRRAESTARDDELPVWDDESAARDDEEER